MMHNFPCLRDLLTAVLVGLATVTVFANPTSSNYASQPLADGDIDPSFATSVMEGNGRVNKVITQPDGRIIVIGLFYLTNGSRANGIARLNADGTSDSSFNETGSGASGEIFAVALQPDGKIIIGGNFTSYDGQTISRLARLNPTGSVDSSFNVNFAYTGQVRDVAVQSDGKLLIGGALNITGSNPTRGNIIRLAANGSLDANFNNGTTGTNGTVHKISIRPDGKILLGGEFTAYNGASAVRLVLLATDGSRDSAAFNTGTGPNGPIYDLLELPDGTLWISGVFSEYNSATADSIAKVNLNGSLILAPDVLARPGFSYVLSLVKDTNGKIVFSHYNDDFPIPTSKLLRLNSDGTVDTVFSVGDPEELPVRDLALDEGGNVLVVGDFVSYNSQTHVRLVRLQGDGVPDSTFNPQISMPGVVYAVKVQPDGKILIAGDFEFVNNVRRTAVARLNMDGSLDTGFDFGRAIYGDVFALAVQADGKILIGGNFSSTPSQSEIFGILCRLNVDGSLDSIRRPSPALIAFSVNALAVQPDGKVIAGGDIRRESNFASVGPVRYNPDLTEDSSFAPIVTNGPVRAVLLQPDGKIIFGGQWFPQVSFARGGIARLNGDGSLDSGFSSNAGFVYSLARSQDGKIISAGTVIRRFTAEGDVDMFEVGTGTDKIVRALHTQRDNKILFGGVFESYNGTAIIRLGRILTNGVLDSNFNTGSGVSLNVQSIAEQVDGKILVGGQILNYNGTARFGIVRLINQPVTSPVMLSGRVTTPDGRGLRNAVVSITGPDGVRRTATTSSFGLYNFDNVLAGGPYTIGVSSKRYRFSPQIVTLNGNLSNVDFVGLE